MADVSILLTLDDTDNNMFLLNKKTYQKLSKENNVETIYLSEQKRFNNIELKHLEENIYNNSYNIFKNDIYRKVTEEYQQYITDEEPIKM